MAEEFGTRDVLGQVDTRLTNVEQDVRSLRTDVRDEFAAVRSEMREGFAAQTAETMKLRGELNGLRIDINVRFESHTRWIVGLMFASWISIMASVWLKP